MFFQACPNIDEKSKLIDSAKMAREERAVERKRETSAIKIQTLFRKYLARCKFSKLVREEVDAFLQIPEDLDSDYKPALKPAQDLYHIIKKLLMVFKQEEDRLRFEYVCRYIMISMGSETMNKTVYASVVVSKDLVLLWISQVKHLLAVCLQYYLVVKPELHRDMKLTMTLLLFQVTFTNAKNWRFMQASKSDILKACLDQMCKSCLSHLTSSGLYTSLRALLISGLCKPKPIFKSASLNAIITLAMRPLIACDFSDSLLTSFLLEVMSVPGLLHHITVLSVESLAQMMAQRVFSKCLDLLVDDQAARIIFNALEGNYALCLLANLIQLGNAEKEGLVDSTRKFMAIATKLLDCCRCYVESKKSHLSQWHPVLGWFAQKTDPCLQDSMAVVSRQLSELWGVNMIRILFEPLFSLASSIQPSTSPSPDELNRGVKSSFLKKAFDKLSIQSGGSGGGANSYRLKIDSQVVIDTCAACNVYLTGIHCLTQLRMEIMAGLCFQDILLPHLWLLITNLGSHSALKTFLDAMATKSSLSSPSSSSSSPPSSSSSSPPSSAMILLSSSSSSSSSASYPYVFSLLQLACDMAKHVITILDDVEMYELEQPFPLQALVSISHLLNYLVYRSVWAGYIDIQRANTDETFNSVVSLLLMLHSRDCRRSFTPPDHWLIKDIKSSSFMSDLSHNKPIPVFLLQKVPHIIPHKERISLFRKLVARDKESLGIPCTPNHNLPRSTGISIHRRRIVEDGYRQLALLSATALKGVIRVKFINEQGLDEAGIDQDGVFKEFLEETIKRVFDPALNLFKVTTEQKLYPSPTSYLQDNCLALFEFVGRVLGKAVYEGIVVDVPFASFFLSQLLGHTTSNTYSSIDELPSLDPELYKSLSCIKRYEGDVRDLDLTFSYDEDIMGRIVTHELIPGGRAYPVTNENRISYLHLMAHFKMQVVIKDQCHAFITGFKTIINSEWLNMFSGPELQKLISGDTNDIDLHELRKHTHYYGGFHNNHRVINWLWSILEKDFTPDERRLFLKFVTSCSKGPLLGFSYLEPPFSIRCVEVSEDQDSGDTVSSVLKGFFNIRRRDPVGRLPTSSTCFNLLKLPNYHKKSTLRDKLRYSITSNTGFELS